MFSLSKGATYADVDLDGKMVKQLLISSSDGSGQMTDIIGDKLFPFLTMNFMPPAIGIIFIIALISALFPSADGALTALTSSFCIDILGMQKMKGLNEKQIRRRRLTVHFTFAFVFLLCILVFYYVNNNSIIDTILDLAGYTYGPLLGLFAFGILTKRALPDSPLITVVCLVAPVLSYIISGNAGDWFMGFQIGLELLLFNGLFTFLGLLIISRKSTPVEV